MIMARVEDPAQRLLSKLTEFIDSPRDPSILNRDWLCPKCGNYSYAKNIHCKLCHEARPTLLLIGGEWECPVCRYFSFSRNLWCRKCESFRPDLSPISGKWKCPLCGSVNFGRNKPCFKCGN